MAFKIVHIYILWKRLIQGDMTTNTSTKDQTLTQNAKLVPGNKEIMSEERKSGGRRQRMAIKALCDGYYLHVIDLKRRGHFGGFHSREEAFKSSCPAFERDLVIFLTLQRTRLYTVVI